MPAAAQGACEEPRSGKEVGSLKPYIPERHFPTLLRLEQVLVVGGPQRLGTRALQPSRACFS